MEDALTMGLGPHKNGGGCAEINCIELLWEVNGKKDPDKSTSAPRVAIWVRPRDKLFGTESNEEPCTWKSNTSPGYGCDDVIRWYGIEAIDKEEEPDISRDDEWQFEIQTNYVLGPRFQKTPYEVEGGEGAKIGKCHLHLDQYHTCNNDKRDLAAEVRIWDVGGNKIGFQARAEAGATKPLSVKSKLENALIVTPQHQGDYVQFQLGTEAFDTTQQDEEENEEDDFEMKRGIDCYFQCPYHGGTSSDA
ncbi:MAG: hypothetical protein Q9172_006747 [Xanthocarpia lactea]